MGHGPPGHLSLQACGQGSCPGAGSSGLSPCSNHCVNISVRHPGERGLRAASALPAQPKSSSSLCLDEYLMTPCTMKRCSRGREGAPCPGRSGAQWLRAPKYPPTPSSWPIHAFMSGWDLQVQICLEGTKPRCLCLKQEPQSGEGITQPPTPAETTKQRAEGRLSSPSMHLFKQLNPSEGLKQLSFFRYSPLPSSH